ncbi:MAG: chromophore lyase CpcT/CpeT [Saprospiraceae bacterium]
MRDLKFLLAILLTTAVLFGCDPPRLLQARNERDLNTLVNYMVGDFSSQAQSQRDSDFYDIRLHIRPIWASDKANHWLYVEQATASAEAKPYRQRVYKVENDGAGSFKSIVYTLPDPANWAGKYKTPEAFDALKPADLSLREGCTVFLKKQKDGTFAGATQGISCESTLRGAKYASSKVTITKTMLRSWDQGFNEKGEQMWGATKGGYEFVKQ